VTQSKKCKALILQKVKLSICTALEKDEDGWESAD
jgi:hypothetical protein